MTPRLAPLMSQTFPTSWGGPNPFSMATSPSWNGVPTARSGTPSPFTSPTTAIENPKYVEEASGFGSSRVAAWTAVAKSVEHIRAAITSGTPRYAISLSDDDLIIFPVPFLDCNLIDPPCKCESLSFIILIIKRPNTQCDVSIMQENSRIF